MKCTATASKNENHKWIWTGCETQTCEHCGLIQPRPYTPSTLDLMRIMLDDFRGRANGGKFRCNPKHACEGDARELADTFPATVKGFAEAIGQTLNRRPEDVAAVIRKYGLMQKEEAIDGVIC